jgi:hypothetical protein
MVADLGAGSFSSGHVLLAYRRAVSGEVADTLPGYIVDVCVVLGDKVGRSLAVVVVAVVVAALFGLFLEAINRTSMILFLDFLSSDCRSRLLSLRMALVMLHVPGRVCAS